MSATVPADGSAGDWSAGECRTLSDASMVHLFERRLAAAPEAPAVSSAGRWLTYQELDEASTSVAMRIIDRDIAPGSRVGVLVDRSVDSLVALLAVWKAGCVYLPLDLEHPTERIGYLLADARAAGVVTSLALPDEVRTHAVVIPLDESPTMVHPLRRPGPLDPAYLIYTSGSTGRPKAVEVEHRSLVNVVTDLQRILAMSPDEHWLTMAPSTFDISLAELCVPLAAGARVTITSAGLARDAARLVRLIHDGDITRMQAVPSQWQALVDAGLRAPHVYGMSGGEALPARLATELTQRLRGLVNAYGPTETTVLSTVWRVPADPAEQIRIGRPIANTRVYVLDDELNEVGVGQPGELFVAGAGVARGYAGEPTLTAAAFVDDPRGEPGDRMYRTGDRCRWHSDGNLEYLGRADGQVKIRGQRVELGEVEAGIATLELVGRVVAVVREHDLIAFVSASDPVAPPTVAQVREHAARTLPSAMVPTTVVVLESFPLTPNGKIDRAALDGYSTPLGEPGYVGHHDPFTAEFCALVQAVLGAERVEPADDFFDVGGHSLAVMRVTAAIAERWHVEVASDVFYEAATVAELASAVKGLGAR